MRKTLSVALFCSLISLIPGGALFAHGGGPAEALHPPTEIGLVDSRSGHEGHGGGGVDMSANFSVAVEPLGPYVAGAPTSLKIVFSEVLAGKQVKDFVETHTKKLHLIIVSSDMKEFFHVHPVLQADGVFFLENFTFPREVLYHAYFDLEPAGTSGILLSKMLGVGQGADTPPVLENTVFPTRGQGLVMNLTTEPEEPKTVGITALTFSFSDAETGEPISDFRAYLGAPAHLVMLSQDFDYLHVHPIGNFPADQAELDKINFGPEIVFHATFQTPGTYKGWIQLERRSGQNHVIPFVMSVGQGFGLTRDQVAQIVHTTQKTEEARAVVKFAVLSLFILGMLLLFYPRRPTPSTGSGQAAPVSPVAGSAAPTAATSPPPPQSAPAAKELYDPLS